MRQTAGRQGLGPDRPGPYFIGPDADPVLGHGTAARHGLQVQPVAAPGAQGQPQRIKL